MLPDLSKLRSLDAGAADEMPEEVPELPDAILRLISEHTKTCLQESVFRLSWVKWGNILQFVVRMKSIYPPNMEDMLSIKTDLAARLADAIPEALPFSIDEFYLDASRKVHWRLRMARNAFVVTVPPPHPCHNWVSLSRSLTCSIALFRRR
jgi:hypothetical protein